MTRHPLKLGLFMPNCSYSMSISTYKPNPEEWEFEHNVKIALAAEEEGFDFLFPVARWRGLGGETNFLGTNIDTFSWAASLLQRTTRIGCYSTVHVPVYHPFVVAKMGASLDYISGGRWGLNVASGWNHAEFSMMGLEIHDHERRYEKTTDYLKVIKGLWTAEPGTFDFKSDWYQIEKGWISPLPKSSPHPPIVNAGTSEAGRNLVANFCDWSFMCPPSIEAGGEMAKDIKRRASVADRDVRCVAALIPIWGDSTDEAEAITQKILDNADKQALEGWMAGTQLDSQSFDSHTLDMFCLGAGSLPIIGTKETVAEALIELYQNDVDGVMLGFVDYLEGTQQFGKEIMPLLREAGIR